MIDEVLQSLNEDFGRLVHLQRKVRKTPMTQHRLGRLAGLSRTSITNIEKGRQHVSLHQLYRIAYALEIPPHLLLPERPVPGELKLTQMLPEDTDPKLAEWAQSVIFS
ncbi:MAG: helix-turn-helix transcriptional regulator [Gammaproteobacteria bacterium]|nr:helix-turn-helix transcriptional regulator [Gammaproteobacteria bacterium]